MSLFGKRKSGRATEKPPAWTPTVDLATARPAVFALAYAPNSTDGQVVAAIAEFGRLSGSVNGPDVNPHTIARLLSDDPKASFVHRPWIWLCEVARIAASRNDHHLAAACLFWAYHRTMTLVPRNDVATFMQLGLDPIPPALKAEILKVGMESLAQLPEDFVIVGDDTGVVQAGPLLRLAPGMT
jgi:hypothetical protein